ncbi:MAG: DNA helicase RecQ [Thalassobius sp.]|nr:DNA helicase RecQ [Thalassovita sp.]
MQHQLKKLLKQYFGYDQFRPTQEDVINRTLSGKDSLVIMPTGGGKSLCYQLPALAKEGTALVISPLIALMEDQVQALQANGVSAAALNSNTTANEIRIIEQELANQTLKLLYVSPERALQSNFISFINQQKISLVAIDEAHCVSIWGNDFRPEYMHLPALMKYFDDTPFIALTATADKATQKEIMEKLKLRDAELYLSSFERKNLTTTVLPANKRIDYITDYVKSRPEECGIIYCLSRKSTEKVAQALIKEGVDAAYYHADISASERQRIQKSFQQDDIKVICATIAFGMGIDKSNIRYVIHHNLPKNLESYYQEIGRAGRDGLPSECILFFSYGDGQILQKFIEESQAEEVFKNVQRAKLSRMLEFGAATSCRTNFILSYFGEHRTENCGHCDNCLHPPRSFDGTVIAQKALSAVVRMKQQVGTNMLVDVLRGSNRKDIQELGYNQIKTFGAGSDISRDTWLSFISQLINQGFLELDFTDGNKLKVTEIGKMVLFNGQKVKLSQVQLFTGKSTPKKTKKMMFEEGLIGSLRKLRKEIADAEGVPAYVVFNDQTLQEMAAEKPLYLSQMAQISGIGKHKLNKYGEIFIKKIQEETLGGNTPKNIKGKTYLETLKLIQAGKSVNEISILRKLNEITVYSHIAYLFEKGEISNIEIYIDKGICVEIGKAWEDLNKTDNLKELFDHFRRKYEYYQLRLGVSWWKKEMG